MSSLNHVLSALESERKVLERQLKQVKRAVTALRGLGVVGYFGTTINFPPCGQVIEFDLSQNGQVTLIPPSGTFGRSTGEGSFTEKTFPHWHA